MKFLLCSALLVAMIATGLTKPMNKDIDDDAADSQEQYAKYAAMSPDELDEELAKLHRQLDENEAALQEYEAQERKHNLRMKHQKAMEDKLSKYQPGGDEPAGEEDYQPESYMEEQDSQFKSDDAPIEQEESEKEPDAPEKEKESYEMAAEKEPEDSQPEKDQGYMSEEPEEPISQDTMEPEEPNKEKQNEDAIEEEYMVPQEREESPQEFAKRVHEWDQVESLDHEDEDVNVENEFDDQ